MRLSKVLEAELTAFCIVPEREIHYSPLLMFPNVYSMKIFIAASVKEHHPVKTLSCSSCSTAKICNKWYRN